MHAYTTNAQPVPQIARIGAANAGPAMRHRLLPADAIETAPMMRLARHGVRDRGRLRRAHEAVGGAEQERHPHEHAGRGDAARGSAPPSLPPSTAITDRTQMRT